MSKETFNTAQSCTYAVSLGDRMGGNCISTICYEEAKKGVKKYVLDFVIPEGVERRLCELGFVVDKTDDGNCVISWQ